LTTVPDSRSYPTKGFDLRAALPAYARYAALGLAAVLVIAVGVFLFFSREPEFRMSGFPTQLSDEVVATVNGYERRETEGDRVLYVITADKATTFADNHQELENIDLQVFDAAGGRSDRITAAKSVYVPGKDRDFTAYFAGDVDIMTRDELHVKTEQLTYKKSIETAEAEEEVEFSRANISGRSFGATVKIAEKRIELLRDVFVASTKPEGGATGVAESATTAGSASYDQASEQIELRDSITSKITSISGTGSDVTNVNAATARVYLHGAEAPVKDISRLDLIGAVKIDSDRNGSPTQIRSEQATYLKAEDRYELSGGSAIDTNVNATPTNLRGSTIVYHPAKFLATIAGGAEVVQVGDSVRGDSITANLYGDNSVKHVLVRGNSALRQDTEQRTSDVTAAEITADFDQAKAIRTATAAGSANAVITPKGNNEYTRATMSAPNSMTLQFRQGGVLEKMQTNGRTTIKLDAVNAQPDSASKILVANTVRSVFGSDGQSLARAEAEGSAELQVLPLTASADNYHSVTTAPRFDCEFYPAGNVVRTCIAATGTTTVRTPTVNTAGRGPQKITSQKLVANFDQSTQDLSRLDASGNAKFVELERNAVADSFSFDSTNGIVMLRGGEPTIWDSQGRARAAEIDWNTKTQRSALRGGVSTTVFSQEGGGGATPFSRPDKPVFITADSADFDHNTSVAVYTGNARGWQADNYVRGNVLTIRQNQGSMSADGAVQTLLYDTGKKGGNSAPVTASAARMHYDRNSKRIRYEENVDIRQGTDRMVGGTANIFLNDRNEIERSDVEGSVVITQPNRKATGDYAQYTLADERVVLRGRPATVSDAINGSSQGSELVVFLRENRIVGTGSSTQDPKGRIRSVHKIKNN
jgi:lipopolysaccharide transport protein LptA/LPS export ABC transporter protein LptC